MLESRLAYPQAAMLPELSDRIAVLRETLAASVQQLQETQARLRATQQVLRSGRTRRQQLHDLVFARLLAQLETMPVIEQAKGVLMAQTGCSPEQAFDMLRRASQRSNVRVSELAADIVQRTAGHGNSGAGAAARPRPGGQPA